MKPTVGAMLGPGMGLVLLAAFTLGSGPATILALSVALLVLWRAPVCGVRSPLAAVAAFVLLASHFVAADPWWSSQSLAHWALLALAFSGGAALARAGEQGRVSALLLVLGLVWSLQAFWQLLVVHPQLLESQAALRPELAAQLADGRANAIFLVPGQLGAMLSAIALPGLAAAAAAWLGGRRRSALLWGLSSCGLLAGLFAARSMASALLLGLGVAVLGLLSLRGRARVVLIVASLAAGTLLGGLAAATRLQELRGENPASARAANWIAAERLIRERPVLGFGGGAFAHEYGRVRPVGANEVRHAHQAFLEAAAEHGLVMLPLLGALIVWCAREASRFSSAAEGLAERLSRAGPAAAAAVLVSHGFLDFGWSQPEWAALAALILGLASFAPVAQTREAASRGHAIFALSLGIAVFVVTGLARFEERSTESVRAHARLGDHGSAVREAAELRENVPWSAQTWALEAEARLASGERTGVATLSEEAIARSPRRASLRALNARALLAEGRRLEAWLAAEHAVALAPTVKDWKELRDALRPEEELRPGEP